MVLKYIFHLLFKMTVLDSSVVSSTSLFSFSEDSPLVISLILFYTTLSGFKWPTWQQNFLAVWLLVKLHAFFFFPVCTDVILESSSQKGFRGYPFIFLLALCFHVLAHLSAARHFLPTLYSVFFFPLGFLRGSRKPENQFASPQHKQHFLWPINLQFNAGGVSPPSADFGQGAIGLLGDPWAITLEQSLPCGELRTALLLRYSVCSGDARSCRSALFCWN